MTDKPISIVLVHGGFVDGSGWRGVHQILTSDGYEVIVVQNPTLSLTDDVAVTKRPIASAVRSNRSLRQHPGSKFANICRCWLRVASYGRCAGRSRIR